MHTRNNFSLSVISIHKRFMPYLYSYIISSYIYLGLTLLESGIDLVIRIGRIEYVGSLKNMR
jgi:hypothetical protein